MSKDKKPTVAERFRDALIDMGINPHVSDALALSVAVSEMRAEDATECKDHIHALAFESLTPDVDKSYAIRAEAMAVLSDLGLPIKRLAAECKCQRVTAFDWSMLSGLELLQFAAERLAVILGGAPYEMNEPVMVRMEYPEGGASGKIKRIKPTANGYMYGVHVDGTSALRIIDMPADALVSLLNPQTSATGHYYYCVWLEPNGNEIVFPYPDQASPDEQGAFAAARRFENGLKGIFAIINGLRNQKKTVVVEPKGTYCRAEMTLGGDKFDTVLVGGPIYERWLANELGEAAPAPVVN